MSHDDGAEEKTGPQHDSDAGHSPAKKIASDLPSGEESTRFDEHDQNHATTPEKTVDSTPIAPIASAADAQGDESNDYGIFHVLHKFQHIDKRRKIVIASAACLVLLLMIATAWTSATPLSLNSTTSVGSVSLQVPDSWTRDTPSFQDDTHAVRVTSPDKKAMLYLQVSAFPSYDFEGASEANFDAFFRGFFDSASSSDNLQTKPSSTDYGTMRTELGGHTAFKVPVTVSTQESQGKGTILFVFAGNTASICAALMDNGVNTSIEKTLQNALDSISTSGHEVTASFVNGGIAVTTKSGWDMGFGATIIAPDGLEQEGYVLSGWQSAGHDSPVEVESSNGSFTVSGITDNIVLNAVWKQAWTVTFTDGQGSVISTSSVADGEAASAPLTPQRDGALFSGWDADYSHVTDNLTVNATWTPQWTVTFTDGQGNTISTQLVKDGGSATPPSSNPTRPDHVFKGWDGDYSNVTSDLTINAIWQAKPTKSQLNALARALSYLDYSAFSYSGLVDQLEFEKYPHEDAVYAADNCGADWNAQAARKAQQYLDYSAFSRGGLIDQLEFEGFTADQALYGVNAVGL